MLVKRPQWGARPPKSAIPSINSVITTGHWEGPGLWGGVIGPHSSCAPKVRAIQDYHMDHNGWSDIAYNAVACPHGYVFEGRGPQKRSAANGTNYANDRSAVVCYLGGQGDPFPQPAKVAMLDAAQWLGDPIDKGHRDWFPTACPGDEIYAWIYLPDAPPTPIPPTPPTPEDELVPLLICAAEGDSQQWLTDLATFKRPIANDKDWNATVLQLTAMGAKLRYDPNVNTPVRVPPETLASLPEVQP